MQTKICSKCGKQLPLDQFYWRNKAKGERRAQCKKCHNSYVKMMYNQKHQDIETLKSFCKCAKCGESRGYVLDFHHKDPSIKEDGIAQLISNNATLTKIKEEIDKCIVLCANCHRQFHFLEKKENITIDEYLNTNINIKYSDLIQPKKLFQPITWKQKQSGYTENHQKKKNFCIDCGQEISLGAKRCTKCYNKAKQIIKDDEISKEKLKQLIRNKPFTTIAKQYNVSDNAIRKWCDKFNLPRTKKEINLYTDEEWEKI